MRAILRNRYGDENVIEVGDIDEPSIRPGRVLVRVAAASIGQDVWHTLSGPPLASRLAFGLRRPRSKRLGGDFAGVIEAVGDGVDGVSVGDRVAGNAPGAFADLVLADPRRIALVPPSVTDAAAASIPVSGCTAVTALTRAFVGEGTRVLITGAAGGVGHLVVQLAALAGATVTAVCRPDAADFVRELGAHDCIDYTACGITESGRHWDVIIEIAGRRPIAELRAALAPGGTAILVGGEGGGRVFGGFGREVFAGPAARLGGQRVRGVVASTPGQTTGELLDLVAAGQLRPFVHTELPMIRAAEGVRLMRAGRLRGKVVLHA